MQLNVHDKLYARTVKKCFVQNTNDSVYKHFGRISHNVGYMQLAGHSTTKIGACVLWVSVVIAWGGFAYKY